MSEENKQSLLSDKGALDFLGALCVELLDVGEAHTQLITEENSDSEQAKILMKANTMMVFASLVFMSVVQDKIVDVAKLAHKIWTSPLMTDLNLIAFKEEIDSAKNYITSSIVDVEAFINKEKNGSSGESSDGSSDL